MTLDGLTDRDVERLVQAQENLFIERKERPPRAGIGPTIASFANTLGGWLILGVADNGRLIGYEPPGRADAQDHIRDLLRGKIDALPSFVAQRFEHAGVSLVIVRVAESADTPHVTEDGAIYLREPGGKQRIQDHRTLLELARRGADAEVVARQRLSLPLTERATCTPDRMPGDEPGAEQHAPILEWVLRAAPLTLPPQFADLSLSAETARWAEVACAALFGDRPRQAPPLRVGIKALARGLVGTGLDPAFSQVADVVVAADGVVAARVARRRQGSALHLPGAADGDLFPLLRAATEGLTLLGAAGRTIMQLDVRGVQGMAVHVQTDLQALEVDSLRLSGELPVPAEESDLRKLADRWYREIGRAAGFHLWEPTRQLTTGRPEGDSPA